MRIIFAPFASLVFQFFFEQKGAKAAKESHAPRRPYLIFIFSAFSESRWFASPPSNQPYRLLPHGNNFFRRHLSGNLRLNYCDGKFPS